MLRLTFIELHVAAFQYLFDTLLGALMMFVFIKAPATKRNIAFLGVLAAISSLLVFFTMTVLQRTNIGIFYTLFTHVPFILCFVAVYKIPIRRVLTTHFLTYNLLSTRQFFGFAAMLLFERFLPEVRPAIAIRVGWIVSGPFLVAWALNVLTRKNSILDSENRAEQIILFRSLGAAYLIIQLTHFNGVMNRDLSPLFQSMLFSILLLSFILTVCMYTATVKESEEARNRNTAYAIQTEGLAKLTEAMSNYLENTARLRHDHKHFLNLIEIHYKHGNLEEIGKLAKKNMEILDAAPVRETGDNIVDGIIDLFRKRSEEAGIAISMEGVNLMRLPIDHDDLCLLLSNCLENAIEATKHAPPEERLIEISVTANEDSGTIGLLVRNPCVAKPEMSNQGTPISRKGNTHGFGTRSMKLIVTKYGGLCSFTVEDNLFCFRAGFFKQKEQPLAGDPGRAT